MNMHTSRLTIRSLAAALLLPALSGGCSWIPGMDYLVGEEEGVFRDRQGEYLEAETIPRTDIPANLDSYVIDDLYVVPPTPASEEGERTAFIDAPRPQPLEGSSEREVVIQRMNDRSWVVVDVSPSQVWPRVRDYWTGNDIELVRENPTAGIMETRWFVREGNSLTQEKYRITVEPGFQDDSSEIRLLHFSLPQGIPAIDNVQWPEESSDKELAYERLTDLSNYLADVSGLYQASSVSFLAGNIPSEGKANMVSDDQGRRILGLEADYERSWAAVGRALQRAGVEIVSQDVSEGVYDVTYIVMDDAQERGFFGKLVTLEYLRGGDEARPYNLRVRLEEAGPEQVNVRVDWRRDGEAQQSQAMERGEDPQFSLLRTILNYIA